MPAKFTSYGMRCLPLLAIASAVPSCATANSFPTETAALRVVNARMDAYNRHDLEAFLATYADDVQIYTYPTRRLGSGGIDQIRRIFAPAFAEGDVRVEIHHQIAKDAYVVNHETVTQGDKKTEYVSVYEVRDGRIASVRFIRD